MYLVSNRAKVIISEIQQKVNRHAKKQENIIHNKGGDQSSKTDMLKLADKEQL